MKYDIDPNKGIIISYQRSGLNWIRYCIEHFTGLRTPGQTKLIKEGDIAVYRTHNVDRIQDGNSNGCRFYDDDGKPLHNKVVLLLRDYRESFLRVAKEPQNGIPELEDIENGKNIFNFKNYFENLKAFDKFKGKKLLIRYEDLIKDFTQVTRILDFLGFKYNLEGFDLEEHRQKSVQIYDTQHESFTKDNLTDFEYHQKNADSDIIKALDVFVNNNYKDLIVKYFPDTLENNEQKSKNKEQKSKNNDQKVKNNNQKNKNNNQKNKNNNQKNKNNNQKNKNNKKKNK